MESEKTGFDRIENAWEQADRWRETSAAIQATDDDEDYAVVEQLTPEEDDKQWNAEMVYWEKVAWKDATEWIRPILQAWRAGDQHKTLVLVDEHCEQLMALFDPENSYLVRQDERRLEGR